MESLENFDTLLNWQKTLGHFVINSNNKLFLNSMLVFFFSFFDAVKSRPHFNVWIDEILARLQEVLEMPLPWHFLFFLRSPSSLSTIRADQILSTSYLFSWMWLKTKSVIRVLCSWICIEICRLNVLLVFFFCSLSSAIDDDLYQCVWLQCIPFQLVSFIYFILLQHLWSVRSTTSKSLNVCFSIDAIASI